MTFTKTDQQLAEYLADVTSFFAGDGARRRGEASYPDCLDRTWFFPLQRRRELEKMMAIARRFNPTTVMEIGTDKGGGFYHWVKCLPTVQRAAACEVRGLPYAELFQAAFPEINFLWLAESSRTEAAVAKVASWLGSAKIDALFIDGDKNCFRADFETYLPYMASPGVVFFHDIEIPAIREEYTEVVGRGYRHEEIVDLGDWEEEKARMEAGLPARTSYEHWLRFWHGQYCGVGVIYL